MTKDIDTRELVLGILIDVIEHENYSHIIIGNTLKKYQYLEKQDRAFISRLSEGCIENLIQLDYIINLYSSVKTKKMKPVIRNILRMGVYQIKYMDNVPVSAACNEAVNLAKKKGFQNLKGFVNGVLRSISRNIDQIELPDEKKDPVLFLSISYSVPEWIVNKWLTEYNYDIVKNILMSSMEDKMTTIRCHLNKITPGQLEEELKKNEISVQKGDYLPYALKISGYNYINQIPEFEKGFFQIQDESSMLVAEVAGIKEHDYVMDVCAAPGGKSLHAAEKLNGTGLVSARDLTENKVSLIKENVERLQLKNVEVKQQDALVLDEKSVGKADILIADLPCSGLGVFGKKTDIKYKMTPEKQKELVKLQRKILQVVTQYVKPNGVLLYSTCTINRDENIGNVEWIVSELGFDLESIDPYLPKKLQSDMTKKGFIQLLPGIHTTDGFFIARLRRK